MNDQSEMPFGKHKGKKLEDVPASYLLWLWDNGVWSDTGNPLHNYIRGSFTALETEAKDYIVQHVPDCP